MPVAPNVGASCTAFPPCGWKGPLSCENPAVHTMVPGLFLHSTAAAPANGPHRGNCEYDEGVIESGHPHPSSKKCRVECEDGVKACIGAYCLLGQLCLQQGVFSDSLTRPCRRCACTGPVDVSNRSNSSQRSVRGPRETGSSRRTRPGEAPSEWGERRKKSGIPADTPRRACPGGKTRRRDAVIIWPGGPRFSSTTRLGVLLC